MNAPIHSTENQRYVDATVLKPFTYRPEVWMSGNTVKPSGPARRVDVGEHIADMIEPTALSMAALGRVKILC